MVKLDKYYELHYYFFPTYSSSLDLFSAAHLTEARTRKKKVGWCLHNPTKLKTLKSFHFHPGGVSNSIKSFPYPTSADTRFTILFMTTITLKKHLNKSTPSSLRINN